MSQAILALVGALILMKVFSGGSGPSRSVRCTHSAPPTSSPSAERRRSANHEAGHLVVNSKLGGRSGGAVLFSDSTGEANVTARTWRDDAIMSLAGEAVSGPRGADSDRQFAKRACRKAGMSMPEARREAKRMVRKHNGAIKAKGRTLARKGRIS